MSNTGHFRISLHVSHPTLSADRIVSSFDLRPKYARSVGEPRLTKRGESLGGSYKRTDVSFHVSDNILSSENILTEELIEKSLNILPLDTISHITNTDGECFFLIGIFSGENFMCNFQSKLLTRLSEHGIGLKLDFYGGPDITSKI